MDIRRHLKNGWFPLILVAVTMVGVWLVLLPRIAARPSIRTRIDTLERQGIDPSAIFYTELEKMGQIESRLTAIRQQHPEAFWRARKPNTRQGSRL
jgi:hypothetical protein